MSANLQIQQAATIIQNNGVICYPTESVYGLGCDPLSETAVSRILKLKNRSVEKGLIIVAGNLQQLTPFINVSEKEIQIILNETTATTWLVKKSKLTPAWVSGKHSKVAIRISCHPLVTDLCKLLNKPIISTSANPAGAEPALNLQKCKDYFSDQINLYLDASDYNSQMSGQPTPIKDIENLSLIRN